ncbi:DUF488 family protein [Planctomyces sp. SH-PL62]|uniref:DUF488 domain-containing protein n=1 Tax=Planctomyces sp. SH-PL62 TaxID=1636152 RepID=UPI00078EE3CD|nr:DUF488 domain-containing protein [Planctomyces sp. SH-PL62]AMV37900.1 hypothetical protein VT85_10725 [Planctomyces sp. SH-PL62]
MKLEPAEAILSKTAPLTLFTIGHSTHPLDEFLRLLAEHNIQALADIRRFPGSRKYPHFNRENLASTMPQAGVEYRWIESLGGRRKQPGGSTTNLGLRNQSFRNYADYMATPDFHEAIESLLELARQKRTAFMCSEGVYWRCHRRLVSDYLGVRGIEIRHIMPSGTLRPHILTEGARVEGGELSYPSPREDERASLFE